LSFCPWFMTLVRCGSSFPSFTYAWLSVAPPILLFPDFQEPSPSLSYSVWKHPPFAIFQGLVCTRDFVLQGRVGLPLFCILIDVPAVRFSLSPLQRDFLLSAVFFLPLFPLVISCRFNWRGPFSLGGRVSQRRVSYVG